MRRLAFGATTELFEATEAAPPHRPVALKRLLPHAAEDPEFTRAFIREGELLALLDHPLIAKVYAAGCLPATDPTHPNAAYLAMELVRGHDLHTATRLLGDQGTLPAPSVVAALAFQAATALDYAHTRVVAGHPLALVHRDISPHNLMLTAGGLVQLIDFGIATFRGRDVVTQAGVIKGKHAYMSPEQIRGEPLDARSDLFALGVVLWEFAAGVRLFRAPSALETFESVLTAPVPPLSALRPDLPAPLSDLIMRCLARPMADRPATAAACLAMLGSLSELPAAAPSPSDRGTPSGGWAPHVALPPHAWTAPIAALMASLPLPSAPETLAAQQARLAHAELGHDPQLIDAERSDITQLGISPLAPQEP